LILALGCEQLFGIADNDPIAVEQYESVQPASSCYVPLMLDARYLHRLNHSSVRWLKSHCFGWQQLLYEWAPTMQRTIRACLILLICGRLLHQLVAKSACDWMAPDAALSLTAL
jgi:hypothetical protein